MSAPLTENHCGERRCNRCQGYPIKGTCACRTFDVAIADRGEVEDCSWQQIRARDAEDAAEEFAERYDVDSAEYRIVRTGSAEIWTRDDLGTVQKWEIDAEPVPTYNAREKT